MLSQTKVSKLHFVATDGYNVILVDNAVFRLTLFIYYIYACPILKILYDTALWKNFSATVYRKLKSAYNKCIKKMFGYTGSIAWLAYFFDLSLPTLDTAVRNSRMLFANQSLRSCNKIVQWFLPLHALAM